MLDNAPLFDDSFSLLQNPNMLQAATSSSLGNGLEHFDQLSQSGGGHNLSSLPNTDFDPESYPNAAVTQLPEFDQFGEYNPITGLNPSYPLVGENLDVAAVGQRDPLIGLENSTDTLSQQASHPLDPLTEAEIEAVVSLIQKEQDLSDSALFPNISLLEPDKNEVLEFTPGSSFEREAFVTVLEREQNKVYEAIVDLETLQLTSWEEIPGAQPALTAPEFEILSEAVKADPRWQEAMIERGITDFDDVVVDGWAPGNLSPEETASGARLIRGLSYYKGDNTNFYGGAIEGVLVTVDLNTESVADFVDTGVVPFLPENFDLDEESVGDLRETPPPLIISQPDGLGFEINGNEISWENWNFRYSMHPREGLVLHQVGYEDQGELRPIIYRAGLSEMVVPYADPDETWIFRNAFDVGEYGLGRLSNTMELGREVPENAVLLDAVFADDFGEPYEWPQSVGIYERDSGLLWQHYDYVSEETEGRRGRELVMTFISTIGNYDYQFDWIFGQDGSIEVETHLTGILLTKGTAATDEDALSESDRYGELVAENVLAPAHQHFFNFRLDMDVDGVANSVYESNINAVPLSQDNPEGNAFVENERLLETEAVAQRDLNWQSHREWEIINAEKHNALGGHIGYMLEPGKNAVPFASPQSGIRQRASFTDHQVWFTQYKPGELYAAGDYPNQSSGGQGLPQYAFDNESLVGKDTVLWYTLGSSHHPRPEDWPVMPVETVGFKLVPKGFFTRNPALDVPSSLTED